MHLLVAGINYQTAPVEIRERLSFQESDIPKAMKALQDQKSILENVVVSTCNRTELYAVVDQLHTGRYYLKKFLADWFDLGMESFSPYVTFHENSGMAEHLMRVASGLDSMVLGETQILGQVRKSFFTAQELGTTGTILNRLFQQAITVAKKGHTETEIGANAVSVSYAAVELAKKVFGSLADKHVVIVGAGKMGQLAMENLYGQGVKRVTVLNRTFEKAEELAQKFQGEARSLQELQCALLDADILISSTGSKEYVLTKEVMSVAAKMRRGKPIFLVDIAVPRNLDPALAELDNVFLYDIDDLEGIVQANLAERKEAADQIGVMIEEQLIAFEEWLAMLGVVPVITALREKALSIQAETMQSIERKLPNLTERERKVLSKHTKSIVNQMLKDPVKEMKELASGPNAKENLALFQQIFGIEDVVQKEPTSYVQEARKTERAPSQTAVSEVSFST
ncbi:glutamyl-tRNA reductase [Bacillus fonticola]|uniref:glutamyl-tRNA reductase n=1 Tax=Bacillus fonticola TaxID=2728853 RepID=UPI0014763DA1|nr:glutamyl-tRNA reductase [Bacillus fonticola]